MLHTTAQQVIKQNGTRLDIHVWRGTKWGNWSE